MASWGNRQVTDNHLLPYVDSSTAPPEVAAALHTLPFERNIFKLLANAPTFFPTFMKLLSCCCWSTDRTIRSSDWQLTVLRTASLLDAPYVWDVNEPLARIYGFDDEKLQLVHSGDLSSAALFSDRQRIINQMVGDLVKNNMVSEPTMLRAKRVFGDTGVMEILLIHGIYSMLARTMKSAKIDFDPPIPDLEDQLRQAFASAIEKEKALEEADQKE